SIPATVSFLLLLDGFNQPLNFIPPTVKFLFLHKISYQLTPGSIPYHLTQIGFSNGFSQRFTKGIIPDSIANVAIGDVVYALDSDSISNPNHQLLLLDGFNHPLDFIPSTVQSLFLQNIKYQLKKGSIPKHLNILGFTNGFDQELTKDIIPDTVTSILIGDVVHSLKPDSISNSEQIIYYYGNYKHKKINFYRSQSNNSNL
ncbi:hypothetical protein DICPUDRAFT_24909, partial [Dictyostelium purpureum]